MKSVYLLCPHAQAALVLQTRLRQEGIEATLAPTPREADHCCGLCIFLGPNKESDRVQQILEEGYAYDGFFEAAAPDSSRLRFL